ncbi:hypothetical protein [Kumtagia ephedrae]|jgi:hypothetical protein|uniref:DUF680 domain-containing protein n=1 Tax=Kumtagia ephedrae TaxID=2116701 RepID=A0A2P7S891_9HYPH|nr:hypothetical protein [Mesorhizobium ephedrae]PSJ58687.1 hypothetical protein C7I84_14470 [Mesorhizobium ephedrae]
MTKLLLIAAGLGLAVSGAQACEYQKSVKATELDKTTVASVAVPQSKPVVTQEAAAEKPQVEKTVE